MDTDLTAIKAALADLSDAELAALIAATYGVSPVPYGLLIWVEGSCDWELNRRAGHDYELLPPEAAMIRARMRQASMRPGAEAVT